MPRAGVDRLDGREQVNALHGVLESLGVRGEVSLVRRIPQEHRLVMPVIIPGREVTVDVNLTTRPAVVTERTTGTSSALVYLHKMLGQH